MVKRRELSLDDLLAQATCSVKINGSEKGTAWLFSRKGFVITAGHILIKLSESDKIHVQFTNDERQYVAELVPESLHHNKSTGLDFAVLKIDPLPVTRIPLPVLLTRSATGTCSARGYGVTLGKLSQSPGIGSFISFFNLNNSDETRMFEIDSKTLREQGYSGAAIYSHDLDSVVAIQTRQTLDIRRNSPRDTVLALPLYRVAEAWPSFKKFVRRPTHRRTPFRLKRINQDQVYREVSFEHRQAEARNFFFVIDGPKGYGKTRMLQEVQEEAPDRWYVKKIVLNQSNISQHEAIIAIASEFNVTSKASDKKLWYHVAEKVQRILTYRNKQGLLLTIDGLDNIDYQSVKTNALNEFLSELGKAIAHRKYRYKILVAGKQIRNHLISLGMPIDMPPIKRYCAEESIKELLQEQNKQISDDDIKKVVKHLDYLSGQHPDTMVQLLRNPDIGFLSFVEVGDPDQWAAMVVESVRYKYLLESVLNELFLMPLWPMIQRLSICRDPFLLPGNYAIDIIDRRYDTQRKWIAVLREAGLLNTSAVAKADLGARLEDESGVMFRQVVILWLQFFYENDFKSYCKDIFQAIVSNLQQDVWPRAVPQGLAASTDRAIRRGRMIKELFYIKLLENYDVAAIIPSHIRQDPREALDAIQNDLSEQVQLFYQRMKEDVYDELAEVFGPLERWIQDDAELRFLFEYMFGSTYSYDFFVKQLSSTWR